METIGDYLRRELDKHGIYEINLEKRRMLHDNRTGNALVMQQRGNTEALTDRRAVMVYPYLNHITAYIQSLALHMSHRLQLEKII